MTVHGCAVRSPLTGCQVKSRPRDHFSRYSKWLDTFRTAPNVTYAVRDGRAYRGCQVTEATNLCMVSPNICESSGWNVFHHSFPPSRILKCSYYFWGGGKGGKFVHPRDGEAQEMCYKKLSPLTQINIINACLLQLMCKTIFQNYFSSKFQIPVFAYKLSERPFQWNFGAVDSERVSCTLVFNVISELWILKECLAH